VKPAATPRADPPPAEDPESLRVLAEDTIRKAGEALRQVELPAHVEPSFVFRP
jgi:hypothetical protein